jgi:hypothetical protein
VDDVKLTAIRQRTDAASPGPWFVRYLDDEFAANLVAVSTAPAPASGDDGSFRDGTGRAAEIVAATLVQNPQRYVDIADGRWDENAESIANAREDIPLLLEEIERLRSKGEA